MDILASTIFPTSPFVIATRHRIFLSDNPFRNLIFPQMNAINPCFVLLPEELPQSLFVLTVSCLQYRIVFGVLHNMTSECALNFSFDDMGRLLVRLFYSDRDGIFSHNLTCDLICAHLIFVSHFTSFPCPKYIRWGCNLQEY